MIEPFYLIMFIPLSIGGLMVLFGLQKDSFHGEEPHRSPGMVVAGIIFIALVLAVSL